MLKKNNLIVAALTLVSTAVLTYELTQIRVFSFSLHPVIAYSAIAIAMLGFGLGATVLALRPAKKTSDPFYQIGWLSIALAASIVLVNLLFSRASGNIIAQGTMDVSIFWIAVVLLPCVLPYCLAGMITTSIFHVGMARIGRLYFWNLLGSAAGSIAMVLLLRPLGAERLVLLSAAAIAAIPLVLSPVLKGTIRPVAASVMVVSLVLLPFASTVFPYRPDVNGYNQLFEKWEEDQGWKPPVTEMTTWDPIGRIDVQNFDRPHLKVSENVDYRVVTIDGGAMTLMLEDPGTKGWGKSWFGESLYAMAYQIKKKPDVLVIGAGGGPDVQAALHWEANSVDAVEISLATKRAVSETYAEFVGWPLRDEVTLHHGDGRAFAKSTEKRFDVIQMSGVDTMTMHTSGSAMVAAEDYLYTVEAFGDFLEILKPGGVLSVMRFGNEAMTLSTIAALALREMGVKNPQRHIMSLRQANLCGILVSLEPFEYNDVEAMRKFTSRKHTNEMSVPIYDRANVKLGVPVVMLHPEGNRPAYRKFFNAMAMGKELEALQKLGNYFVVPRDDQPYYILGTFYEALRRGGEVHPAMRLLIMSTKVIGLASLALILLPAFFVRRKSGSTPGKMISVVAFFFSIGACFMLLEIGLIHKATVFVSTPGAAVAVVLSAILVSSGVGALVSDMVPWSMTRRLVTALGGLIVISVLYKFLAGPMFDSLFGLPIAIRCIIAALTLVPVGFFMGWFFPTGIRVAGANSEVMVPWAISVNGFASVVGSLATLFMGIKIGLTGVFVVAIIGYILAVAAFIPLARKHDKQSFGEK